MNALPIFMDIKGRRCVVIGGGEVALRKITLLLRADADVSVFTREACDEVHALAGEGKIQLHIVEFSAEQLENACLVIAATSEQATNAAVSKEAQALRIPVNVVDAPALCTFTMPSIVDRSPVVIAISSGGVAPVLARLIRGRLETLIPASYGRLAELAAKFREQVKNKFSSGQERRIFWEEIFQGPIAEQIFSGQEEVAQATMEGLLNAEDARPPRGEVYLVGGGPGDPDLLTFRALRLMQQSDVCVYDKLVSREVLDLVRRDAEMVYVGKARDQHTLPQEEINNLLAKLAKEGKRVLRLKGGDPFIFGRGGEEIETLLEQGIPFQVVPGITAASGVSSYAGIPLTHRDYAQSCTFTTGHLKNGTVSLDWPMLARPGQTVVIYMGLGGLIDICRQLIAHGLPADTPAAVIQHGTLPTQKVVAGTLQNLAGIVADAELTPPSLIIVGEVVKLREKLNWFHASR